MKHSIEIILSPLQQVMAVVEACVCGAALNHAGKNALLYFCHSSSPVAGETSAALARYFGSSCNDRSVSAL